MIQTLWDDFVAVDAKLLNTIKAVFIPGKYAADWLEGKQNRYVPPIRMYIVVSMLFAIVSYVESNYFQQQPLGSGALQGFIHGYSDHKQLPYEYQIIQLVTLLILPLTVISAQIFNRKSKVIVSVIFSICLSITIMFFFMFAEALSLAIPEKMTELVLLFLISLFTLVSVRTVYKISLVGAIFKTLAWLLLNFALVASVTIISIGYYEAHFEEVKTMQAEPQNSVLDKR
nr:DUF3667 domain-containing protein [Aliikangiella sp. G2MR2-5]